MKVYDKKTKIIKTLTILISIYLLYTNWLVTVGDFVYDFVMYREDILEMSSSIAGFAGMFGVNIDTSGFDNIVTCIIDGKLTAEEMTTVSTELIELLNNQELKEMIGGFSADTLNKLNSLSMFFYLYIILYYGIWLFAAIVICFMWKNKHSTNGDPFQTAKNIENTYFIIYILCFCIAVGCSFINIEGEYILRPTLYAVLGVLLAMPTQFYENKAFYKKYVLDNDFLSYFVKGKNVVLDYGTKIQNVAIEKWTCNSCGKKNSMDSKFCANCGMKKSELVKCVNCGSEIHDDDLFCKKCGHKTVEKKMTCSNCGCSIEKGSSFCQYCGHKII